MNGRDIVHFGQGLLVILENLEKEIKAAHAKGFL